MCTTDRAIYKFSVEFLMMIMFIVMIGIMSCYTRPTKQYDDNNSDSVETLMLIDTVYIVDTIYIGGADVDSILYINQMYINTINQQKELIKNIRAGKAK